MNECLCEAKAAFPWEWIAYFPPNRGKAVPSCFARLGGACGPQRLQCQPHPPPNPAHVFCSLESCSPLRDRGCIITQMICCTVTSSQRCHLKLKIHVKSGDATFKQTVETWSDFTITVVLNPFMPLGLQVGDGRFQGPGHREDVCVNLLRLLMQNTTGWQLIEQILFSHNSGG